MLVLNLSYLNREYILMNVVLAVVSTISKCNLHAIFLSNITQIFYIIYKSNIPFVQCNNRLRRSNSMIEVERPSPVFIDIYVPVLTPDRHLL
jgi:hypothetical protein